MACYEHLHLLQGFASGDDFGMLSGWNASMGVSML
jgi:hypothetical protein